MALFLRPPTSRESLTESLEDLGRTRRAVSVAAATLQMLSVLLWVTLILFMLDLSFHVSPLLRALFLTALLTTVGALYYRSFRPALALRHDPQSVALDLEDRYPKLNDALGSAVAFLSQERDNQPAPGSSRLQKAVVLRAHRLSDRYNFREIVPSGRLWRMIWSAGIAGVFLLTFCMLLPQKTGVAAIRLTDPFGGHPWPPRTAIRLVTPDQIPARTALGDRFDLRFELLGEIPAEVVVQVQPSQGQSFAKSVSLINEHGERQESRDLAVTLDASQVMSDFQFRITANDGDTGWLAVHAAAPPKLVPRNGRASPQIHAEFPFYTRLPPLDLSDGVGLVEVPVGTALTLQAATDTRLDSAVLTYLGDRSAIERTSPAAFVGLTHPLAALGSRILAESIDRDFSASLGNDHRTIDLAFTPSLSGLYGLRLTDETGITGTRLLELRLLADPVPQVVLESPSPGKDPDFLAPDVMLNFECHAEDRIYALRRLFLEYRFRQDDPYRELVLHDGLALQHLAAAIGGGWLQACDPRPTQLHDRRSVSLAKLLHVDGSMPSPGDTLSIRAAADDWDDIRAVKPPGHSGEIELHIATREGIDAMLQKDLAEIRKSLLQIRSQQREARTLTKEVRPELDGTLRPEARDKIQTAEQIQKQMDSKVNDPRDGLRAKAEKLRSTVRLNNLPRGSTRDRVESVAEGLSRLSERELGTIEPLLNEARQAGQTSREKGPSQVTDRLALADRRQKGVEETLDRMLEQLEQWGNAGEVVGEARGLRDAIDQQARRITELGNRVSEGKATEPSRGADRQEFEKSAGKLDQMAEQAGGLIAKAGRFAEERSAKSLEGGQTEAARTQAAAEAKALREAIEAAGGQALPEELRRAAGAVRSNRAGEAGEALRRAGERLGSLNDALVRPQTSSEEPPTLSRRQSADRLDGLAEAQDQLRKKVREASAIPNPVERAEALEKLSREQDQLQNETREVLQKLQRRKDHDAARDVQAAIDQQELARNDLENGLPPSQPQADAIERLEKARDRLDRQTPSEKAELSREVRRKLADQVRNVRDRQAAAVKECERIASEVQRARTWPRPLQASLDDLAARERSLAGDVNGISEKYFEKFPILQRLLKESSEAMEQSSRRIGERLEDIIANADFDATVETVAAARIQGPMSLGLRRLDHLLEALKTDDDSPMEPGEATANDPSKSDASDDNLIPTLAQLKVLRALQSEINERTARFAKEHPDSLKLKPDELEELRALEVAQRDIAKLFEDFIGK